MILRKGQRVLVLKSDSLPSTFIGTYIIRRRPFAGKAADYVLRTEDGLGHTVRVSNGYLVPIAPNVTEDQVQALRSLLK